MINTPNALSTLFVRFCKNFLQPKHALFSKYGLKNSRAPQMMLSFAMLTVSQIQKALPTEALQTIDALPFKKIGSGKVREIYDLGDKLLIVASDRLSAFDVVLPDGIPGKGILLTQISLWWFKETADIMPNHLVSDHDNAVAELLKDRPELIHRSMLVRKLTPMPIEAVVRGYLAGSGWKDYKKTGGIMDHKLPANMQESQKLPIPLFTPSTKESAGHDEPITLARCSEILGKTVFDKVMDATLALFQRGTERAEAAHLILADTKFEFGTDQGGQIYLIDEVLTPDSSRYWPKEGYEVGKTPHAFDKQYVRDYLDTLDWDKTAPGPRLPKDVIDQTQQRYLDALRHFMA